MSMTLVDTDEWRPSIVTERQLCDLASEGLLSPVTSSTQPEWIALPVKDLEPNLPEGYIISFIKFHRHIFGSPSSRFVRVLLHYYGVVL